MGGTSTDVSHYAGEFERRYETQVAGVRMRAPMLSIHTVAAGGGSVLRFDGGRYRVGPDSAGADPGPACYRRGRPLTLTDANVLLGRIRPEHFPRVFGPAVDQPLDTTVVRDRFAALAAEIGDGRRPEEVAAGFLEVERGRRRPRHNVETSQAVTGALGAALGVMAEGSGTMNNVTFDNERHQYCETVASGSGAGDGFDGADAVQTHNDQLPAHRPRAADPARWGGSGWSTPTGP